MTIESELSDDTLNKELRKIKNKLKSLSKPEEKLVNLKLEDQVSDTVYQEK